MRKTGIYCFAFFFGNIASIYAQNISGIINTYDKVTTIDYCDNSVTVSSPTTLSKGDKIVIIQVKGAKIDTNNTSAFGSLIDYRDAGNYELLIVDTIIGSTQIRFTNSISRTYDPSSGHVQLIKTPVYQNASVSDTLSCLSWNGNTGGVLALEADTLVINAPIDVTGKGFRGGSFYNSTYSCQWFFTISGYAYTIASALSGEKGEGVADTQTSYEAGRGPVANGGGGGNDHNSGGGGGGNYGLGGSGGERITSSTFQCQGNNPGIGGNNLAYSDTMNKIFMGGGGGAGQGNNDLGTYGSNGGGIVIIKAKVIYPNGYGILAKGADQDSVAGGDGAGGGGGGGTVLIEADTIISNLSVTVKGGNGGSNLGVVNDCAGPGGGGGAGVVWLNKYSILSNVASTVSGGSPGVNLSCDSLSKQVKSGSPGAVFTNLKLVESKLPFSIAEAGPNTSLCQGMGVQLNATGGHVYAWSPISGLSDPNISNPIATPNATTLYFVTVNDTVKGCLGTDSLLVTVKICTGIQHVEQVKHIEISPNPAKNNITLSYLTLSKTDIDIQILNITGQVIFRTAYKANVGRNQYTIPATGFSQGIYFLRLQGNTFTYTRKVVIE